MAIKEILLIGNETLNQKSKPIDFDNEPSNEKEIIQSLIDTVNHYKGLGLSAPQIGYNKRIIVVINPNTQSYNILINPKIIATTKSKYIAPESCLSVPKLAQPMQRFKEITVEYYNEDLERKVIKAKKLHAKILQHEIDHLNGVLIGE